MDVHDKETSIKDTLEYKINVPVRLLISQIFSHRYTLISDGTFIEIGIFRNLNLLTFGKNHDRNMAIDLKEGKFHILGFQGGMAIPGGMVIPGGTIIIFTKFSRGYIYSRRYHYSVL